MAKFIAISCIGYEGIENMFDVELNTFRRVPGIEIQRALNNKEIIWLRHVNELTQALTLHSIGLSNKEIQASLYDTPPLIPQ